VIIHDDASEARTASELVNWAEHAKMPVILVRSPLQVWFTTSVNRCLLERSSEFVLIINSDIAIQEWNWFQKCMMAWESAENPGLLGQADNYPVTDRLIPDFAPGKVQGHWWFTSLANINKVGLLNEEEPSEIHIRSDDAWSAAFRKAGFKNYLMTNLHIAHGWEGTAWPCGGASWDRDLKRLPKWIDVLRARAHPPEVMRFRC
jgi:hypothetical protein